MTVSQYENTEEYAFGFRSLKEILDLILENSDFYSSDEFKINFFNANGGD